MTSPIAIDFGTTRTKIAYAKADGRLELMEFREGRRYIPSLFHLEPDNDTVLWGDDAEDMLIDDPLGVVTVLKRRLRQKKIRANGRSVSPHDMLVLMFSRLRGEAAVRIPVFLGEPPSALTLTLPALYGQVEEDLMRAAATTAGFERVEIMAEPVAAARAWLGETSEYANDVVVFDCGGGTVDWAYLAERDGSLRLMPQCPPGGSNEIGGHDVDEAIFDRLKQRVANNDKAMRELDERRPYYLGRLRALKEDVSRGLSARPLKIADARVEFSTDEMMAVAQDRFISKACAGLKEYLEKVSTVASEIPPVLHVGGGSELRGLSDEVSTLGLAAEQGEKDAQFRLGKMYQLGDGVTRNQSTALEWFGHAAKQGQTDAKRELAYENFQVDIVSVLKPLADNKSLFVRPDIPENKLNNARRKFDVPAHEDALGLLDSTVWGFSGKGILFGKFGIYCRDNNKVQHVPYSDFLGHSFKTGWVSDTVKLPGNRKFVISSSSVSKKIIADSLNKITAKINAKGVFYK